MRSFLSFVVKLFFRFKAIDVKVVLLSFREKHLKKGIDKRDKALNNFFYAVRYFRIKFERSVIYFDIKYYFKLKRQYLFYCYHYYMGKYQWFIDRSYEEDSDHLYNKDAWAEDKKYLMVYWRRRLFNALVFLFLNPIGFVRTSNTYANLKYNWNFWSYALPEILRECKILLRGIFWSLFYKDRKKFNKAFSIEEENVQRQEDIQQEMDFSDLTKEDIIMVKKALKKKLSVCKYGKRRRLKQKT